MARIVGIAVSPGIAIGRAFAFDTEHARVPRRQVSADQIDAQLARFRSAIDASTKELSDVRVRANDELGTEAAKIFGFHQGMLADTTLLAPVERMIREQRVTAEHAVYAVFKQWIERFAGMADPAFRTKADDMKDLSTRLLNQLVGRAEDRLAKLDHQAVIVAADLTPSQAADLDRDRVCAFVTDSGGQTSHTAIVARALGIPAVVGCKSATDEVGPNSTLIVDGDRGIVIIDPSTEEIEQYRGFIEQRRLEQLSLREVALLPAVTRDGTPVEILANIEFPIEAATAGDLGAVGVGLFRTEFLYLSSVTAPTEDEQFLSYRQCVELLAGKPLTIRTMDLGADKYTHAQSLAPERNPALGLRSIRYCLRRLPEFKTQLRAILRASAFGPIKIMFPLVTNISELRAARAVLADVMDDLDDRGIAFDRGMPVGMMVEVPSAALLADAFARELDFFSIGTNDLVQYTLAVDRTNERVASLYSPFHPAVLKLIKQVTRAGVRHNRPVSCCGESAGDAEFAALLLGLGVRTLSVTPGSIPRLKRLVRSVTIEQCERIATRALRLDSDTQVAAMVRDRVRRIDPEAVGGRTAGDVA